MPQSLNAPETRRRLIARFLDSRARSRALFDLLAPDAYYARPIPLRNPVVFYEGHLPAFGLNTLLKKGFGRPGLDERLEVLFARGIDPEDEAAAGGAQAWPSRTEVQAYADAADAAVVELLSGGDLDGQYRPAMKGGEAVFTVLEHELLHQETLLYMWHRLPFDQKRKPAGASPVLGRRADAPTVVGIPAGPARLGAHRSEVPFGWDNEFEAVTVDVPAFEIDRDNVTNQEYLDFVTAGGYDRPDFWTREGWEWRQHAGVTHPAFWERAGDDWVWRGMFEAIPLPPDWPVYVSHAEASAYARWRGKRLMTEAEYHRAAFGEPGGTERPYPWGEAPPDESRGTFDFRSWDPVPVGTSPAGASAWGVRDLMGNGWEWTATVFGPLPGFAPMASYPEYSADFFDGKHYVMKGASPATARELLRPSLRNWFRPFYPYVYASFRCVTPPS